MGPATNGTPTWAGGYPSATEAEGFRVAEYDRLIGVYPSLGYDIHVLSKVSVAERADFGLSPPNDPPACPAWVGSNWSVSPCSANRAQCFELEPAAGSPLHGETRRRSALRISCSITCWRIKLS